MLMEERERIPRGSRTEQAAVGCAWLFKLYGLSDLHMTICVVV